MLRGNSPAKIDDRGRLKIPNGFRSFIEDEHGRDLFVTSVHGDSVRIYPMPVWADIERKLASAFAFKTQKTKKGRPNRTKDFLISLEAVSGFKSVE